MESWKLFSLRHELRWRSSAWRDVEKESWKAVQEYSGMLQPEDIQRLHDNVEQVMQSLAPDHILSLPFQRHVPPQPSAPSQPPLPPQPSKPPPLTTPKCKKTS